MLAGRIKLRTFGILVAVVAVGGIGAGYMACSAKHDETKELPAPPPTPPPPAPKPLPPPDKTADAGSSAGSAKMADASKPKTNDDLAKRAYDDDVLAWKTKTIASDKLKDVSKGKPYKLDVFADDKTKPVNRAKLDLNRNGKWDEKYTFKGDEVTLQRAPADDEKYTETYHWSGTGWVTASK